MRARNLHHRVQRDRIQPLLHLEQERLDDGEGERQLQPEGRALPGMRVDMHCALEAMHHALHHIHADSAPGDFGDFLRRAEARPEHKIQHFRLAKPRYILDGDHP